jgi:Tfp pilus assembly protein PilX
MRFSKNSGGTESGVVAIFTVLFFTILITVLVVGFLQITITEQQQSTDNDLTARAYYAAESGVEDVKRALMQYYPANIADLNATTCTPPLGYSGALSQSQDIGYSCKLIDLDPTDIEATLPGNNTSMQWPLEAASGDPYNQIQISWHNLNDDNIDGPNVTFRTSDTLPTYGNWDSAGTPFPAMLRMQIFGYPNSGTFTTATLDNLNNVGFLNPATTGPAGAVPIATLNTETEPQDVECTTNPATFDGYACRATIDITSLNTSANNLYIRLKALYKSNGTDVRIQLLDNGTVVPTTGAQALVDVTGYAGAVFRRVQERVTLPGTSTSSLLPEFAVESGGDMCKNFQLSTTGETLNGCTVR